MSFIEDLLRLVHKYDSCHSLEWDSELNFYINCNDIFCWGCVDAEDVTPETLPILEQAFKDAKYSGDLLYCARQRKMRPQGAAYKVIAKKDWHLFDACGPEREPGIGDPEPRPED